MNHSAAPLLLGAILAMAGCGGGEVAPVEDAAAPQDFARVQADLSEAPIGDLAGSCAQSGDCTDKRSCCGGACTDTATDPLNCGACGVSCGAAKRCCAGSCVDLATDAYNCGACGTTCMSPHAAGACSSGMCALGACSPGWADCNMDGAKGDGCETNLRLDVGNCGSCGKACKVDHGTAGCAGSCYLQQCDFGYDDCNGDPKDGCETSTLADVKSCGMCGHVCPPTPNAQVTCSNGLCTLASCSAGFLDCDRNPANGCEVNVVTDARNCGGCGLTCAQGLVCRASTCTCPQCVIFGAVSKCVNNMCVLDKCLPGYSDCDGKPQNGCEVDTTSDNANCGGCGKACPPGNPCVGAFCTTIVVSDTSWVHSLNGPNGWQNPGFNEAGWVAPIDEGAHGTPPWNNLVAFNGTTAHWIWYYDSRNGADTSTVYFRRQFTATNPNVTLTITADDNYVVYLDGNQVAFSNDVWSVVHTFALVLIPGKTYQMAISVKNTGGPGGLLLDMK